MNTQLQTPWQKNMAIFLSGKFFSENTSMIVEGAIMNYLLNSVLSKEPAPILSLAVILSLTPLVFLRFFAWPFLSQKIKNTLLIMQSVLILYLPKEIKGIESLRSVRLSGIMLIIILSLFIGGFIDHRNKKNILIVSNKLLAIFSLLVSIIGIIANKVPLWLLFAFFFLYTIVKTIQIPTIQSVVPTIAPQKFVTKISGISGIIDTLNLLIVLVIAPILFRFIPLQYLILLEIFGALLGNRLFYLVNIPRQEKTTKKAHVFKGAILGLKQLANRKGLVVLLLMEMVCSMFFWSASGMYHSIASIYWQQPAISLFRMKVIYLISVLIGNIVISIFSKWKNRITPMALAALTIGIATLTYGFLPRNQQGFIIVMVLNGMVGFATPFLTNLFIAIVQQSCSEKYLGRALGIVYSFMNIGTFVSLFWGKYLNNDIFDNTDIKEYFIITGLIPFICGILIFLIPAVRNYDVKLQEELTRKENVS